MICFVCCSWFLGPVLRWPGLRGRFFIWSRVKWISLFSSFANNVRSNDDNWIKNKIGDTPLSITKLRNYNGGMVKVWTRLLLFGITRAKSSAVLREWGIWRLWWILWWAEVIISRVGHRRRRWWFEQETDMLTLLIHLEWTTVWGRPLKFKRVLMWIEWEEII